MRLTCAMPQPAASLTSAVRRLTGHEELEATRKELDSARASLEVFRQSSSLDALTKQASSKRMSSYGIFVLCFPPIGGMFLASKIGGGELAILTFAAGLIGGPALGFYLMGRAARAEAAEKFAQAQPQLSQMEHQVNQLQARYDNILQQADPNVAAAIQQDEHKVVINGVPLARRKER